MHSADCSSTRSAIGIVRLVLGTVGMAAIMAAQRRSTLGEFFAQLRREWWVLVAMGLLVRPALADVLSLDQALERVDRHAGVLDVWGPTAAVGLGARLRPADEGGAGWGGARVRGDVAVPAVARIGRDSGRGRANDRDGAGDRGLERLVLRLPAAVAPAARPHGPRDPHLGAVRLGLAGVRAARAVGDVDVQRVGRAA